MNTKSVKSTTSVKSIKSLKSFRIVPEHDEVKRMEFEEYIKEACLKFEFPDQVIVKKEIQNDDYMKKLKQTECTKSKRMSLAPQLMRAPSRTLDTEQESANSITDIDNDAIFVTAVYSSDILIEISLQKQKSIPRILMQILGVVIPYYRQVIRFNIKACFIDNYTVYELNKFLPFTNITEVIIDDCSLPDGNFTILLERPCQINYLSLCRCSINDEACTKLASSLNYKEPAEACLMVLNLSSNRITDVGAEQIGLSLRSNRRLRYLNLSDNHITDVGANHILTSLTEFILTDDEILAKRKSYFQYLKKKQEIYLHYLFENMQTENPKCVSKKRDAIKKAKEKPTDLDISRFRAECFAAETMGPFVHPFTKSDTKFNDKNSIYCTGNFVLCYLNLSYNDLTYLSVKKLNEVLKYQSMNRKPFQYGLMKVVLEGNNLPIACNEMTSASELLTKNVISFSPRFAERKKTRTRISIVSTKF